MAPEIDQFSILQKMCHCYGGEICGTKRWRKNFWADFCHFAAGHRQDLAKNGAAKLALLHHK